MKTIFLGLVFFVFVFQAKANGDDIKGKWQLNDKAGKPVMIIQITEDWAMYSGKVIQLFPEPGQEQESVCDKCTGDNAGEKIIGMDVISDLKVAIGKDGSYKDGEFIDINTGKEGACTAMLKGNELKIEFEKSSKLKAQTWIRVE